MNLKHYSNTPNWPCSYRVITLDFKRSSARGSQLAAGRAALVAFCCVISYLVLCTASLDVDIHSDVVVDILQAMRQAAQPSQNVSVLHVACQFDDQTLA